MKTPAQLRGIAWPAVDLNTDGVTDGDVDKLVYLTQADTLDTVLREMEAIDPNPLEPHTRRIRQMLKDWVLR
jgi:hypothetical protein